VDYSQVEDIALHAKRIIRLMDGTVESDIVNENRIRVDA
jgi:hypothetical protein